MELSLAGLIGAIVGTIVSAFCYAPLVMINLRVGLALWVPLTFL